MTKYVCGFAFDDNENVALIRKERPEWQKGFLNGVGGHVEEGEDSHEAMVREFKEEAGLIVSTWEHFVTLKGGIWSCDFYRAFSVDLTAVKTMTDEEIVVCSARLVSFDALVNLQWLIPLALDLQPLIPNLVIYD